MVATKYLKAMVVLGLATFGGYLLRRGCPELSSHLLLQRTEASGQGDPNPGVRHLEGLEGETTTSNIPTRAPKTIEADRHQAGMYYLYKY